MTDFGVEPLGAVPGEEQALVEPDEFGVAPGETLADTLDLGKWAAGIDLEALYTSPRGGDRTGY